MSTASRPKMCKVCSQPQTGGQTARQEARRLSSWLLQACKPVIMPLQTARLHHSLAPRKTRLMRNPAVDDFCLFRQLLQDSNQALLGRQGFIRDMRSVRASSRHISHISSGFLVRFLIFKMSTLEIGKFSLRETHLCKWPPISIM